MQFIRSNAIAMVALVFAMLGRLLGDILVLVPSARGHSKTRRIPFRDEHGHHIGGTHHLALLNHPEVYARMHGWLATAPKTIASAA